MEKKRILVGVSNYEKNCPKARQLLLDKGYELVEINREDPYTKEELLGMAGEYDGVIAGMEPWCEEVLKAWAPRLKVVARFGVGYDTVDLDAAKANGVIACNVRSFMLSNSVAEYALTLMLTAMKNIIPMDKVMHENKWDRFTGHQLYGKTVGIMGFGAIGRCFARLMKGFDVKVLAYDPYPNEEAAKELGVTFATKEEVIKQSDCITLHIPNTPENYHFIDKDEIAMMKDGVVIVNTARGPAWNLDAIYEGVKSGKIGAAGVDVYEQEPPERDMPILQCPNVVFQPHSSSETWESKEAVSVDCAQCVIDVLEGKVPKTALNV